MTEKSRKQQIEAMLADDPNDPFLRYGLAMEYVSEGNDAEAARCFAELLTVAPDYVPGYLQAGQVNLRLGRAEEARQAWTRGIAVARRQGDGHAADEMQGFLASLDE
jgi:cytochrome c-type biogenesis protein CcmH/NrfG